MNGCVVAEKTLACYKGDEKPRTNTKNEIQKTYYKKELCYI